jgi:nucleoside-diphosphate-sugar epimerase
MGGKVEKLIHLSSVSVYGPSLKRPARENDELKAHTLTYAVHKKESELAVQARVHSLGGCDVHVLRPHIFAGATVNNYMIDCIRGTAYGQGRLGRMLARRKSKLPIILPMGKQFLEHKLQFAHVDDVARVIAWLLARPKAPDPLTILNVAGRGDALTVAQCAEMIGTPLKRLPTVTMCRALINTMWNMGATSIPPDSFPYLIGSYTLDLSKLRSLLADDYEKVIRYSNEGALADSAVAGTPSES